jgi:osmoprotectant transport system substrate-binding protein
LLLGLLGLVTGCSPSPSAVPDAPDSRLVVASFNFPESELLAEIYAQSLEAAGVPVRRELGLGPREVVGPALDQGFVDLVPEYLGSALTAAGGGAADPSDSTAVRAALSTALGHRALTVLNPSPAENQNGVAVTRAFATEHGLSRLSELAGFAAAMTFGGPAECPTRRYCLPGLADVYGFQFPHFMALDGPVRTRRALIDGVVDAGLVFTTDGQLADGELVLLADDRHLQPAENLVPVVRTAALERHGPEVRTTLDAVSAAMTTTSLRLLNWRVSVDGRQPAAEARGWLIRHGLIDR